MKTPLMPRYSHFWDVGSVLHHIKKLGDSNALFLKWITALTRPSRSADLSKQSRLTIPVKEFFFPYYTVDKSLCPVMALQTYEEHTASLRSEKSSFLFWLWIGKHKPVTSSTIARWLRTYLQGAGIDTDTLKLIQSEELHAQQQPGQICHNSRHPQSSRLV